MSEQDQPDELGQLLDALCAKAKSAKQVASVFDRVLELLRPHHRGMFWGDRMLTLDKLSEFREDATFRAALRTASPLDLQVGLEAMISPAFAEPGVCGVRRPVLLLPVGITDRLTPPQLKAIVAHELCHVRRRDNLATTIHMSVEALFWFHPLVWWLGARLMEEHEVAAIIEFPNQTLLGEQGRVCER